MNRKTVAVLPGDGIGPEVLDAALPVIEALDLPIDLHFGDIGWHYWRTEGTPVPDRTWDLIARSDAVLLGATTSKPHREALAELAPQLRENPPQYVSPIVQLRQRLDLFANLRPVESYLGGQSAYRFCVVRENTEGLYAGMDFHPLPDVLRQLAADHPNLRGDAYAEAAATVRLQTGHGIDRLLRFAFQTARDHGYPRVTLADKPNVLRASSAFVRQRIETVAADYADIPYEILNVDAVALWMTRRPERFGVIVAENMFGDILSDLGAGVMGGLGLAPSANIGTIGNYFEPVHGSAPALAGQGRANPLAALLTIALMLRHIGFADEAAHIHDGVKQVTRRRISLTYDLGGRAGTSEAATAAIRAVRGTPNPPTAAVVTVGDELLRGDLDDTNATRACQLLAARGIPVRIRGTAPDDESTIADAIRPSLGRDDVVVVIGGLGPTSDDVTRDAVAQALGRPLEHREQAWQAVVERLTRFGVTVHADNRRQALFAAGATLLPNDNGTAWGCRADAQGTTVLMLPGPPRECLPMLEAALTQQLGHIPVPPETVGVLRRTLGVIEADLGAMVDALAREQEPPLKPSYRWHYPYVDIKLQGPAQAVNDLAARIDTELADHIVTDRDLSAVDELVSLLERDDLRVDVDDQLTAGALATALGRRTVTGTRRISIGLSGSWSAGSPTGRTGTVTAACTVRDGSLSSTREIIIPNRGPEVSQFLTHFAAWTASRVLTRPDTKQDTP